MNRKTLLRLVGAILLLATIYELLTSGALATISDCGLDLTCPLPEELPALQLVLTLFALGVLSLLASIAVGRKTYD